MMFCADYLRYCLNVSFDCISYVSKGHTTDTTGGKSEATNAPDERGVQRYSNFV